MFGVARFFVLNPWRWRAGCAKMACIMEDDPNRERQDAAHSEVPLAANPGTNPSPRTQGGATADVAAAPHRLMLVVGADLRAEAADRPLAYRLVREIKAWIVRHQEMLRVEIRPEVCTDLWYLHHDDLRRLPTVCLGGPRVNLLSAYLARHLLEADRDAEVLLQIDPEFTDLQACLWGADHKLTAHGLDLFIEQYLDGYLRAVATQVEP